MQTNDALSRCPQTRFAPAIACFIAKPVSALLVLAFGLVTPHALGQDKGQPEPAIDPAAMTALNKMGAYLRTLKVFRVLATMTTEDVLDDGRKIQFASTADLLAQRPDRLRLDVDGDRQDRGYYFNGKAFTLWAERTKFYATVPAPSTIAEFLNQLESKYDIELPFADLFRWGEPGSSDRSITAALSVGLSDIEGTSCTHYSFRQPDLDWQVWIQNGDFPLPRKLVITTTSDESRPQVTSVYSWNLAPAYSDEAFTFAPPAGAMKIILAEAGRAKKSEGSP
jgi:hypothetical protein